MATRFMHFGLVLVGLFACAASARCEDTLRIATFNCQFLERSKVHTKFGLPFDEKLFTPAQLATWTPEHRLARLQQASLATAAVIKRINADVIALVEVGPPADIEVLRAALQTLGVDYAHVAVCDSADTATHQHVAVFSRRAFAYVERKIPGRELYYREEDDPESEDDTGISKGLRVGLKVNDQLIHLFVTHLISERGGAESDAQRIAQASLIRRNYLPLLQRGQHVIVAGDLNEHTNQPTLRRIRGFDDIEADLLQTGAAKYFDPQKLDTRWTSTYLGVREQVDHILISGSLKDATLPGGIRTETLEVTEQVADTNRPASDHRALAVTLEFR